MSADTLQRRRIEPGDAVWGLRSFGCEACDRVALADRDAPACPCGAGTMAPAAAVVPRQEPEQLLVPRLTAADLPKRIAKHLQRGLLRVGGLDAGTLADRAILVWWPCWLVDATVASDWSAEVGFDYEARSTVEVLQGSTWRTIERVEPRIRWAPRAGRLRRRFNNVPVDALQRHRAVRSLLDPDTPAAPFHPAQVRDGLVLLPDLSPGEVWAEAEPAFRGAAAAELVVAAEGQHIRDVHLEPSYHDPNWTVRLHPVWWTWGRLGDGRVVPVLIDAVTGRTWGPVPASMPRAMIVAVVIGGIGLGLLGIAAVLMAIGLVFPVLWLLVPFLAILGLGLAVVCPIAPIIAWTKNRKIDAAVARLP